MDYVKLKPYLLKALKSFFEGYGNFNNTRNGAEIETLKEVNITKGQIQSKVVVVP